jgi:hypothetical protein
MSGAAACSSQHGTAAQQTAVSPGSRQCNIPALPEAALAHGLQQQDHPSLQEQPVQQQMPSKPVRPAAAFAPAAAPAPDPVFADIEERQLQGARLAGMGPLRASAVAAASNVAGTVGPAALSSRIRPSAALEQQLQVSLQPAAAGGVMWLHVPVVVTYRLQLVTSPLLRCEQHERHDVLLIVCEANYSMQTTSAFPHASYACLQKELVLEDIDDEDDVHSAPVVSGANSNSSGSSPAPSRLFGNSSVSSSSGFAGSSGSSSSLAGLQPLLPEQQRQLSKLLWGAEVARPDASWQQGLVFAETPGLEWGLVQLAGKSSCRRTTAIACISQRLHAVAKPWPAISWQSLGCRLLSLECCS